MSRYALPYPVPPGTSDEDAKGATAYFEAHPGDYKESRQRAGITLERAYLQKTPMGSIVVAYIESDKPYMETLEGIMDPSLELNRFFADFVQRVHGLDPAVVAAAPPPETIGEWTDPTVTTRKAGLAFSVPGIPGQEEYGKAFTREALVTRKDEFIASRRALGESVEVITLLQTPTGPFVSVYLEGDDPVEANRRFAASQTPFDRWFKDECRKVFPPYIDFDQPLPPIEQFFDSTALLARV